MRARMSRDFEAILSDPQARDQLTRIVLETGSGRVVTGNRTYRVITAGSTPSGKGHNGRHRRTTASETRK